MGTFISVNGREQFVQLDLIIISGQSSGLGFNNVPGTDWIEVVYRGAALTPGASLINNVVNNYSDDLVFIYGETPSFSVRGDSLSLSGGAHTTAPGPTPSSFISYVVYDVTSCDSEGYLTVGINDQCIAMPRHVILFHELAHVFDPFGDEATIIKQENLFRRSLGLPLRMAHEGGCSTAARLTAICKENPDNPIPPPDSDCFVATAATGGPFSPEVCFLRSLRDDLLLKTRWGKKFFEMFYKYYYQFSPDIASRMRIDPTFQHAIGWAIVTPLLNYYLLVISRPNWKADKLPSHIQEYLELLDQDINNWLSEIELPKEFDGLSVIEIADELSVILGLMLRDPTARHNYLKGLTDMNILPLSADTNMLRAINQQLIERKISYEDRSRVIGAHARNHIHINEEAPHV